MREVVNVFTLETGPEAGTHYIIITPEDPNGPKEGNDLATVVAATEELPQGLPTGTGGGATAGVGTTGH